MKSAIKRNRSFINIETLESRRMLSASVQLGDSLYFAQYDAAHGLELWKSNLDGMNATLLKDLNPGTDSSYPSELFVFNNKLIFQANYQLWMSDGTADGTLDFSTIAGGYGDFTQPGDGYLYFLRSLNVVSRTRGDGGVTDVVTVDRGVHLQAASLYTNYKGELAYIGYQVPITTPYYFVPPDIKRTIALAPAGGLLLQQSTGILTITGTSNADQILASSSGTVLSVNSNGQITTYLADPIKNILISAGDGNDRITIDSSMNISTKIYAGLGDDTIFGGNGADRVYGGDGNDWMAGNAGNDILYGEAGNDRIFGGDGKDYLDGGAGNNVLRGEGGQDRIFASRTKDDFKGNAGDLISLIDV